MLSAACGPVFRRSQPVLTKAGRGKVGLCEDEQMAAGRCRVRSRAEEPWLLLECPRVGSTAPAATRQICWSQTGLICHHHVESPASRAVCCLLDKSINYWLDQPGLWSVLLKFRLKEALPKLEPGCSCTAQHRGSLVFSAVSCMDGEQYPQGMCGVARKRARYHQPS